MFEQCGTGVADLWRHADRGHRGACAGLQIRRPFGALRQAQICRQGIDLDRSTLAARIGKAAYALKPVFNALISNLERSGKLCMEFAEGPWLQWDRVSPEEGPRPGSGSKDRQDRAILRHWFKHRNRRSLGARPG